MVRQERANKDIARFQVLMAENNALLKTPKFIVGKMHAYAGS
jgi:hypothetical protein